MCRPGGHRRAKILCPKVKTCPRKSFSFRTCTGPGVRLAENLMTWARHPTVPTLSVCSKTLPLRRCKYKLHRVLGSSEATPQRAPLAGRQTGRHNLYICLRCLRLRPPVNGWTRRPCGPQIPLRYHSLPSSAWLRLSSKQLPRWQRQPVQNLQQPQRCSWPT